MAHLLQGANHTAQWFQDSYPGAEFFTRLDKFVLHTTETTGWPGYDGGAKAPNATYHPALRQVRQHFYSDRSSRALVDPTNTAVRENRDNVFQLEIICYSDKTAAPSNGLWVCDLLPEHYLDIADMMHELHLDLDLPLQESVEWHEGRATFFDDVRLTGPQFDSYKGILGHCHVSGNTHWDPGGFYISKLMNALEGDVGTPAENADAVWDELILRDTDDTQQKARTLLKNAHKAAADSRDAAEANTVTLVEHTAKLAEIEATLSALELGGVDPDVVAAKVVELMVTRTELGWQLLPPSTT